jgi:hypothetical protein
MYNEKLRVGTGVSMLQTFTELVERASEITTRMSPIL